MPSKMVPAPRSVPANETTVGNYFISNYPPFSFWRAESVPEAVAALDQEPQPGTPLGLYLHIPFCRKRCHFCYFRVYTDRNSSEIRTYLEALVRELRMYAHRAFIGDRKLSFIYFGGGTPSQLSSQQLRSLVQDLKEILPWGKAQEITFECEPGTLTESKLEIIRKMGVTRLSLGVENFDDQILEINGRAHRSKEIWSAYRYARSLNFPQINVDLIAGMVGETEENWRRCIDQVVAMGAESVTIYQMEIPHNTTVSQEMTQQRQRVAPVADWPTKRSWVNYAFSELENAGYQVSSGYTAVEDPQYSQFLYRDQLWKGADLVGLGVASFSHVGGTHFQNEQDLEPYLARIGRGELPLYRALTPTREECMLRELILQLKLGRVRKDYFKEKFGLDIVERFAVPLKQMQESGLVSVDNEAVNLSREGLLRVDSLLPEFFLPQHRDARYT